MKHGWRIQKLGDLFEFKYGKGLIAEHRHVDGSVKVYGSNGIIGRHNHSLSKGPTVVVGRKGSVGEVHFNSNACWPIDTTYYLDEFPDGFPPKYWAFYLKSLRLGTHDKSSAIPGVSREDIYGIEVPVPSPAEQHRIVAKLEKLLAKVETCQERLNKIPATLKRFRQSVLAAACSGRLTVEWRIHNNVKDEFEQTTIEAIADYFGGFAYKSPTFLETGKHQVIRIGNVRPLALKLDASPVFVPDDIAEQTQRFRLFPGDIAISMTGTKYKQDYGYAALVVEADGDIFLNQRIARLRCGNRVLPKFLLFWLQTEAFRDFFFAGETGNVNQGNVGADGVRKAPIELPSITEQKEIIRRVEALFKIADRIEERYKKAKTYIDKLSQSVLAKAFRGELVPQDPKDEPASVLLERIHASKNGDLSNRKPFHSRKARIKK